MNPLGQLPASNTPQFSLNGVDAKKIFRFLLVQAIGGALTFVPVLAGISYVYKGQDYTLIVMAVVNTLAEAGRRFLAGN